MSAPEVSQVVEAEQVLIDLPPMALETRARIARFLVEQLSRRALAELGLVPGDPPE